MASILLVWSAVQKKLLALTPTEVVGGETHLHLVRDDAALCAGVPVSEDGTPVDWDKIEALIEIATNDDRFAWISEILFDARDKTTKLAFLMRKLSGVTLTEILIPAERETLGLDWGPAELAMLAALVADLFQYTERFSITQNDGHPGQYLVTWNTSTMLPACVRRVDARAFGFHHAGKVFAPAKVLPETLPPELQGKDIKKAPPTRDADRYLLATLIFRILTGGAPWDFATPDDEDEPHDRVRKKHFAMLSHPKDAKVPGELESAFLALPVDVIVLFERAFLGAPDKRPSPMEWKRALKAVAQPRSKPRVTWRFWGYLRPAIRNAVQKALPYGRRYRWFAVAVTALLAAWLAVPVLPKARPRSVPAAEPTTVLTTNTTPSAGVGADTPRVAKDAEATLQTFAPPRATKTAPATDLQSPGRKPKDPNAWSHLLR